MLSESKLQFQKNEIIAIVKEHKENHVQNYEKAIEVYKTDIRKNIEEYLFKLQQNEIVDIYTNFGLQKPINNAKEYIELLRLLSYVDSNIIELTAAEANDIINDTYAWAMTANALNSSYSSRFK